MATDQNVKCFISNNGTDLEARSSQYSSSSAESACAPTQETSEVTSHPCAKPYATAAEAQMWAAVEMLKQLEVKLRPIYDGLMPRDFTQEKSESLEQQNNIMQVCETILETVTVIAGKLTQISDRPTAVDQGSTHSWCPNQHVYESTSLPGVILVQADDHCALSGVQLPGQQTCAFVVCRNDYHRIKQLLEDEWISNTCYCVVNDKLKDISHVQPSTATKVHGVTDQFELKEEWFKDNSEAVRSKIVERNNDEEEEEKTGLWSVVASILGGRDDTGSITVKVKDIKEAYQQQQQMESELMQLNSTINECNKILAEKQQTIEELRGRLDQISGCLQTEQGQVSEMICHNEKMFDFLTRKLPDPVSTTENTKRGNNIQPQQTEEKIPKAPKQRPSASNQYLKSDNQPQENHNFNKVREEKLLTSVTNNLKPDSTFPMATMKLESASAGSSENSTKEKEITAKPPKKVNPEDESLSARKIEAKKQHMQNSKSVETTTKIGSSTSSSSSSSNSSSIDAVKSTSSAESFVKKSVLTSTDDEGKDTKKLLDSGDKIHDIKSSSEQQARSDVPKNKPNSQNHDNLSKPNDKLGTPVDPQYS